DPIGRRMYMPTDINQLLAITDKTVFLTVVGVIGDMKLHDLVEGPKSVGAFTATDGELPVFDTQTMQDRTEKSLMTRRSPVLLSLGFGVVALLLSAIG